MNSSTECEDSVTYVEINFQNSRRPGIKDQQPEAAASVSSDDGSSHAVYMLALQLNQKSQKLLIMAFDCFYKNTGNKKKPKMIFILGFGICLLLATTAVIVFLAHRVLSSKCCPEEWMRLNTSCYYLSTNKATWEESKSNCSSMGAHLAVIEDAKDLMSLIRQSGISECFWIGPQDIRSRTDRLSSNPNL
ncbi:CLC2B protein, partial [Polypterus senegalus]